MQVRGKKDSHYREVTFWWGQLSGKQEMVMDIDQESREVTFRWDRLNRKQQFFWTDSLDHGLNYWERRGRNILNMEGYLLAFSAVIGWIMSIIPWYAIPVMLYAIFLIPRLNNWLAPPNERRMSEREDELECWKEGYALEKYKGNHHANRYYNSLFRRVSEINAKTLQGIMDKEGIDPQLIRFPDRTDNIDSLNLLCDIYRERDAYSHQKVRKRVRQILVAILKSAQDPYRTHDPTYFPSDPEAIRLIAEMDDALMEKFDVLCNFECQISLPINRIDRNAQIPEEIFVKSDNWKQIKGAFRWHEELHNLLVYCPVETRIGNPLEKNDCGG